MSEKIFTNKKVGEMMMFCSKGYSDWGGVIKSDSMDDYFFGRMRTPVGELYWDQFNREISCILAIHAFVERYLPSKRPSNEYRDLKQQRYNFEHAVIEYKKQCSTILVSKEIDNKIGKNNALIEDRKNNIKASKNSLMQSFESNVSKVNGIVGSLGALKSMKKVLVSRESTRQERYKSMRRGFLTIASNMIGIFQPTIVGNSLIVSWMISDNLDIKKFEKTGSQLAEDKKDLLNTANGFSGDTNRGDFYTYVLVTALADHYGFSHNDGAKVNLEHEHFDDLMSVISKNSF